MISQQKFELNEWGKIKIKNTRLEDSDRILISSLENKIKVKDLRDGIEISAYQWIGLVQFSNFRIEIRPKFDRDFNLLPLMIEYTNKGYKTFFKETSVKIDKNENLLDLLVRMLLSKVKKILLQGVKRDYNTREESLPLFKGKINFKNQIQRNFNLPLPVFCIYDQFNYDTWENKLILFTLEFLKKKGLYYDLKKELLIYEGFFQQICSIKDVTYDTWKSPTFIYNRQNQHYEDTHKFCKFLINGYGIENVFIEGKEQVFCFLINMNHLFERFIYQFLSDFSRDGMRVLYKYTSEGHVLMQNKNYSRIEPDILVYNNLDELVEIIDVKYKLYGKEDKKIQSGDIYQLYFYSCALHNRGLSIPQSKIVYCRDENEEKDISLNLNIDSKFEAKLKVVGVNIKEILEYLNNGEKEELRKIAQEIVR